jgi:hypothetical protein
MQEQNRYERQAAVDVPTGQHEKSAADVPTGEDEYMLHETAQTATQCHSFQFPPHI